jgi:hypothetical protein
MCFLCALLLIKLFITVFRWYQISYYRLLLLLAMQCFFSVIQKWHWMCADGCFKTSVVLLHFCDLQESLARVHYIGRGESVGDETFAILPVSLSSFDFMHFSS